MGSRLGLLAFLAVFTASGSNYGDVPLSFEPNLGQTSPQVRFLARGGGMTVFVTDTESVMVLARGEKRFAVRMKYLGSRTPRRVQGIEKLCQRWVSGVGVPSRYALRHGIRKLGQR